MKNLNLLLVNPTLDLEADKRYYESIKIEKDIERLQTPHIGIAYLLSSAKKAGLRVKHIDMIQQEFSLDALLGYIDKTHPDLIGFTTWTTRVNQAGFIAEKIKEKYPDILICAGGSHATAIPKQTLKEFPAFDFVIRGEGDKIIPKICETLNYKGIKGVVTRDSDEIGYDRIENIDELPFPAWEEFYLEKYPGADPHQTKLELPISSSRGCFGHCVFCATIRKRIGRSVDSIIAEI